MPTRSDTPPTPQARDAPDGERCVQSNRRPRKNADEPRAGASVCENRGRDAVVQQHRRDQPAPGAVRPVIARQPAGAAQREQRSAGHTGHDSAAGASSDAPSKNATTSGGDTSSIKPVAVSTNAVTISSCSCDHQLDRQSLRLMRICPSFAVRQRAPCAPYYLVALRDHGLRDTGAPGGQNAATRSTSQKLASAANGIRRDAPEPGRLRQSKPLRRAPANGDHCQHGSDEQQLPNLHADIEEQQGDRNRRLRQADLRQRTGEPESVHQPERERHDPRPACGDPGPATVRPGRSRARQRECSARCTPRPVAAGRGPSRGLPPSASGCASR